jgi:hypothetical protein
MMMSGLSVHRFAVIAASNRTPLVETFNIVASNVVVAPLCCSNPETVIFQFPSTRT